MHGLKECASPSNITLQELYSEYINVLSNMRSRESTLEKKEVYRLHISPILDNVKIDKLSTKVLQDWKLKIESSNYT